MEKQFLRILSLLMIFSMLLVGSMSNSLQVFAAPATATSKLTTAQANAIIKQAKYLMNNSPNSYVNYFQKFVGHSYQVAFSGLPTRNTAKEAANSWCINGTSSTKAADIPLGATVYFDYTATIGGVTKNWGHVGIHIGNGQIIHASTTVRTDSLDTLKSNKIYNYLGYGFNGFAK